MTEALLGLAVMFALTVVRIPIAFAMGIVGFFGLALLRGWNPALASAGTLMYETGFSYTLSVVPLFILMGNFVSRAGLSHELFRAAYAFIGHWRGGLAMSTVVACAGFGSICGSSIATAATMSKVAYPSMKQYGYSDALATGSIAAGGTLGILIPPSVIMVIYALMTEVNIGEMFAGGIVPGIVATALLMLAVRWTTWRNPDAGPPGERTPWPERWRALRGIWGVVVLFTVVMGGIYGGVFTVTEGAGIGAFGAFVFAWLRRALTWAVLADVLVESARTTAMLFTILIGALIFANFVNFTSMPDDLKNLVSQFEVHPMSVIVLICILYVLLGTAMEELSMILLTVPVLFPLVVHLGFDPIWFGVLVVVVVEIGLISPPVGMNIFVLRTLLPGVSTGTIYRGVAPFVVADIVRLGVLIAIPSLSTWLPTVLFR
ncbi:MAG: TRAP transporter large permease [Lautropia sp.]